MDELAGLRIFCRVVERESFSAVARELGVSQPSVSRHIASLEERLNARLLVRTTRRVTPTEAGRAFYERASRAVMELTDAENEVRAGETSLAGTLRVSAPGAFGRSFVLPSVTTFLESHEQVSVDLLLSDHPIDLVREGIDLAIRVGTPGFGSLTQRKLGSVGVVLVGARSYAERHGVPMSLEDGDGHAAVLHTGSRQNMVDLVTAGVLPAVPAFNVRLVSDDIEAVRDATLEGLGLSPLPLWLVAEHLAAGRLQHVLPKMQVPPSPVFAVFPSGRQHSARLEAFVAQFEVDLSRRLEEIRRRFERLTGAGST